MANPDPVQLPGGYVGPSGLNEFEIISTVEDPPKVRQAAPWPSLGLGCFSFNRLRADGGQEEMVLVQGKQDERYRNDPNNHTGELTIHVRDGSVADADKGMVEVLCIRHDEFRLFGQTYYRGSAPAPLPAPSPLPPMPVPPPPPVGPRNYVELHGAFVREAYLEILGREPDALELTTDSENVDRLGDVWLIENLRSRA